MSYSRFGYSDIYIYPSVLGDIVCAACFLYNGSVSIENDEFLLEHIKAHRDAGHNIPDGLEDEIISDPYRYRDLEETNDRTISSLATKIFIEDVCDGCELDSSQPE